MHSIQFSEEFATAVNNLDAAVSKAIPEELAELVRLRVSHINGCHYCIDMHSTSLRRLGVADNRIAALEYAVGWATDGLFTDAEKSALRFAEVLTDPPRGVEASAREAAADFYSAEELSAIAEHVLMINLWNRWTRATD